MGRTIRTCSRIALALGLAASAGPAFADVPESLAAYVRARAADGEGRAAAASADYAAALAGSPGNPVIALRAYREALAAGDMALVKASAAVLVATGVAPADTAVLAVADAVKRRDWGGTSAAVDRMVRGPLDFLVPSLRAWLGRERGATPAALDGDGGSALARRFNAETRALLAIGDGRIDEGLAGLRAMLTADAGNLDLRVAAAQLLVGQGRKADARALLSGDDRVLGALRDDLGRGAKADAAFGISRLFMRLAGDIVTGDARPLAIVLARAALEAEPRHDRARLILADALSLDKETKAALAMLDAIDTRGIYAAPAREARVTVLTRAGDHAGALATARLVATAKGADAEDAQRYGDLLVGAGLHAEAAAAYAMAMERAGPEPGWVLYLQRGGALEQAGKWEEARAMLERAVQLAPDETIALNYLGYAKLERGEDLMEARRLLERAVKLSPQDWAATDSLGWAYVQTGEIAKALPLLEAASRAEPADVTVQEHLGDAYWRAGRRYEARYAWRAAAVYAGGEDAARLAGKLASGLPAPPQ